MDHSIASTHFHYSPKTGKIFWRVPTCRRIKRWSEAGATTNTGHIAIYFRGKRYLAHRLAWLLYYGEWPKNQIDHINRTRDDNRISNIRDATHQENMRNRKVQANNSTGLAGVQWRPSWRKWESFIHIDRNNTYLGAYTTLLDAAAARKSAENKHEFFPKAREDKTDED